MGEFVGEVVSEVMGEFDYVSVDGVTVELDGSLLRLRLDRPAKRNAIDDVMVAGLIAALDTANRDERVRSVLLSANGDHFCGGADIVARNAPGGGRPRVGSASPSRTNRSRAAAASACARCRRRGRRRV